MARRYSTHCFALTDAQYEHVKSLATAHDMRISEYMRNLINREWRDYENRKHQHLRNLIDEISI
jgi:hypothetical protein